MPFMLPTFCVSSEANPEASPLPVGCEAFLAFCRARFCALVLFAAVPEQDHAAPSQQDSLNIQHRL